jgi:hypothetical protein
MPDQTPAFSDSSVNGTLAVFLRAVWMLLGNMALVLCAFTIAHGPPRLTVVDIIYWVAVPLVLAARYVDVVSCAGKTATGEPATLKDWRFHAVVLLPGTFAVWAAAHGMALLFP